MEWIIIMIILFLIWRYFSKKSKQKIEQENDVQITISVSDNIDMKRDTGSIKKTQEGGVILSNKSTFPITLLNCSKELATKIKKILDDLDYYGTYKQAREIVGLLLENEVKCKEVEDYLTDYKPKYYEEIDNLIKESEEWDEASEKDRKDLLYTIKKQAYQKLEVRPFIDIDILLDDVDIDFTSARELSKRFGYENMRFYLRLADNLEKIRVVKADHRDRERYENLVKAGLARRGKEIDLSLILNNMKLNELRELAKDWNQDFKRKAEAVEFLKDKPDIMNKLGKLVSFRELFKLNPLPDDALNITTIKNAFEYYNVLSVLIAHTYSFGISAYHRKENDMRLSSRVLSEWEIYTTSDSCDYCKRMAEKRYSKSNYPKTPFHIGCRCIPHFISER